MAVWYCEEVVAGRVPACEEEKRACRRFLEMRSAALAGKAPYQWSDAHVVDFCAFFEMLPHVKGFDGTFVMEPVQCWWAAGIFAFREKETGLRWTRKASLWVPRKNGKALALDTLIPTPTGWSRMGELRIGDEVIAVDGSPTRIVNESPVYLHHDCYRMVFSNGEEIVADAGHRWLTTARVDSPGKRTDGKTVRPLTRVRTTREIAETLLFGARGDRNHSVALPEPLRGEHRALPVDPYLLGAWLGDGTTAKPHITVSGTDLEEVAGLLRDTGVDVEARPSGSAWELILRPAGAMEAVLAEGRSRRPTIKSVIAGAGVLGNKHIPAAYLRASSEQRLALLQGLMDTDGTIDKGGRCLSFCTTSEALRDGFCELLASFGVKYGVKEKASNCNGRITGGRHWIVQFYVARSRLPVFRLRRKLERMREGEGRSRTVQIVSCEPVPSVPVKCIEVEHPSHLFLAGRTMLPTHNSAFAAAVLLFCANCENEPGAEAVISAGSESQAHIPYDVVREMFERDPELKQAFGAHDTYDYTEFAKTGGMIRLATARAKNLDGYNPHLILEEELHSQSIDVINVLETAQAARRNPLVLSISTAGRDVNSPAYDDWKTCQAVLSGRMPAPRLFTALYTASKDDEEHRFDRRVIEKLNPLYGISLNPAGIDEEITKARQSEERLNEYRRTRINVWARAAGNLISIEDWKLCADPKLDLNALKGFPMYVGLDLASYSDLNAAAFLVMAEGCLYAVVKYWLPAQSPRFRDDRYSDAFALWAREKHIELIEGTYVDQEVILERVLATMQGHQVLATGMDTYQHNFLASSLDKAGFQTFAVPKTAKYMSRPTDDIVSRSKSSTLLQHDGNPVTEWCAGNVVGMRDANDNVLPKKERRMSGASIDGMDAMIVANAVRLHFEAGHIIDGKANPPPNPYLTRGLAGAAA